MSALSKAATSRRTPNEDSLTFVTVDDKTRLRSLISSRDPGRGGNDLSTVAGRGNRQGADASFQTRVVSNATSAKRLPGEVLGVPALIRQAQEPDLQRLPQSPDRVDGKACLSGCG